MRYIKNFDTLATTPARTFVLDLIEAAFASIAPKEVFKNNFILRGTKLQIQDKKYDLSIFEHVYVIGFGKGSAGNAKMVEEHLGSYVTTGFVIDVVDDIQFEKLKYTKGTHPLPSQTNIDFTQQVLSFLQTTTERDLVIIITCGGGSVLFEAPFKLTLNELIETNKKLLNSGTTINETNTIRKHLSRVKGGGLAKILYPATVVNLIYSDVPGNDLSIIASGPLVKDHSKLTDVKKIMQKYQLTDISLDACIETPEDQKYFDNVTNILMLSNLTALNAIEKKAREHHIQVHVLTDKLQGNAESLGAQLLEETHPHELLIAGGESTIHVTGSGKGGRNQALILNALSALTGETVLASFGTDGWDFTKYAGAIGDTQTQQKAKKLSNPLESYIKNDDSTSFFDIVGDGIETGHLDSNVSDIYIVYKP